MRETGNRAAKIRLSQQCLDSLKEFSWWPLQDLLLRDWLCGGGSRLPVNRVVTMGREVSQNLVRR